MRAGKLRDRVRIQANVATAGNDRDGYGDVPPRWADVATVYADVSETGGSEGWQADQTRPARTLTVSIRYFPGLTSRHRVVLGSRVLNVESVTNPDGMGREHLLACREEA